MGNADLIFIFLLLLVMYLFFIRPQSKKAKQQETFLDELDKGQNIITIGGIHGKITKVDGDTLTILVDSKTYLTIEKSTISLELTKSRFGSSTSKDSLVKTS